MMRDSDLFGDRLKGRVIAFLLVPILLPLVVGRLAFFGMLDVALAVRQIILEIRDMPMPRPAQTRLLPFWVAWMMAVALLAGGLAGTVLVVKHTGQWDNADQWVTRGAASALALFAFYLAFRLALVGTAALQRALAHNLALLVSFELAELKAETMARAEILAAGGNSPAFRLPFFREEREDIAKLLGEPTEAALRRLLFSLEAFNSATVAADQRQTAMRMRARLAEVDLHLGRAFLAIDPFCQRPV